MLRSCGKSVAEAQRVRGICSQQGGKAGRVLRVHAGMAVSGRCPLPVVSKLGKEA